MHFMSFIISHQDHLAWGEIRGSEGCESFLPDTSHDEQFSLSAIAGEKSRYHKLTSGQNGLIAPFDRDIKINGNIRARG